MTLARPILLLFSLFIFTISECQNLPRPAEVEITVRDSARFNFVRNEQNIIQNSEVLTPFFKKMLEQRLRGGQKISIVHIGDSHVLGDFLTQLVRNRLQDEFGNAGRGLIFPYRAAGSNGPRDFGFESRGGWSGDDLNTVKENVPIGVAGFSLSTANLSASLTLRLKTDTSDLGRLSKITIFHPNTPTAFDFEISDLENPKAENAMPVIDGQFMTSFYFDKPTNEVTIRPRKGDLSQKNVRIDGISIENELSGVLYHAIGVNGARFWNYANARDFAREIADLNPDLIIFSLGTNEAQSPDISPNSMKKQITTAVDAIRETCGNPPILLTTPADSYLRGQGFNPYMPRVRNGIIDFANEKHAAYWDLFDITGGENSAQNWRSAGLFSRDSVHYSGDGYRVQGKLLFSAMMAGYNDFVRSGK
jgi:lysophospholipase L1-like esterase